MRHAVRLLFLLFCLPAALASTPTDDGWKVSRMATAPGDVTTWKKSIPGKPLDAFKGEITVPHPLLTALAVLSDIPNFPLWVFQCDSARMMSDLGPDIAYIYINGIWPVSARDAVVKSSISQDPATLAITVHTIATPELMQPTKGIVRLPALDNKFILTPLSAHETRITFITYADPGGLIPAWLANFVAVKAPLVTLSGMAGRMALPAYQISGTDQLVVRLPGDTAIKFPH